VSQGFIAGADGFRGDAGLERRRQIINSNRRGTTAQKKETKAISDAADAIKGKKALSRDNPYYKAIHESLVTIKGWTEPILLRRSKGSYDIPCLSIDSVVELNAEEHKRLEALVEDMQDRAYVPPARLVRSR